MVNPVNPDPQQCRKRSKVNTQIRIQVPAQLLPEKNLRKERTERVFGPARGDHQIRDKDNTKKHNIYGQLAGRF
jgi:hypothetical protein